MDYLNKTEIAILDFLFGYRNKRFSAKRLSEKLNLKKANLYTTLNKLTEKDLIIKSKAHNKNFYHINLTPIYDFYMSSFEKIEQ